MRLFLAALVLIVGAIPAEAQWLDRKTPGIPRTADGKPNLTAPAPRGPDGKPDLTGVWSGPNPEPQIDPANAQPWVKDLLRQREQNYWKERPLYRCLPSGPESEKFSGWKRIVQTPTVMAILNDDLTYRVIHTDGRQLETKPAPQWMGYSVGRWDGDALIVESVGFNDQTWLSHYGHAHTEALRVREVYRRQNFGHLQVEVTFTDPAAYIKPWGFTFNLALAADTEMLESVCEVSSDHWTGTISDGAVTVAPDVLARYVGVYKGLYINNERTIEVSLSGSQLIARIIGAAGVDGGEMRPLIPRSQTNFEGLGIAYQFIVDDKGVATDLVEVHISGPSRFPRQPSPPR
jgi:hypothetical protein